MTMLLTSDRDRPCRALLSFSSSGRVRTISLSFCATVIGSMTRWERVPLGPFTVTSRPAIVTSTPEGTAIGSLPIRLIADLASPDVGEDFPAHPLFGALPVGAQARRCRDDRDAEPAEHLRQVGGLRVHPQPGLAHPAYAGDRALAVRAVLQGQLQPLARTRLGVLARLEHLPSRDVALLLEDLGD